MLILTMWIWRVRKIRNLQKEYRILAKPNKVKTLLLSQQKALEEDLFDLMMMSILGGFLHW